MTGKNKAARVLWDRISKAIPIAVQNKLFLSICHKTKGKIDKDNTSPTDPLLYTS